MILILFFSYFMSFAENDPIVTKWNEVQGGSFCSDVGLDQLSCFKPFPEKINIEYSTRGVARHLQSPDVFQKLFFQRAAELQTAKNQCFVEQLDLMVKDSESGQESMIRHYTGAWFQLKKIRLYKEKCEQQMRIPMGLNSHSTTETAFNEFQRIKKNQPSNKKSGFTDDFLNQCLNQNKYQALLKAEDILLSMLPPYQSADIFNIIEKHRSTFKNALTGQAFTDKEILALDFSAPSKAGGSKKLSFDSGFKADFISFMNRRIEDRKSVEVKLQLQFYKNNPSHTISEEVRDFIFADGTAIELANQMNLTDSAGFKCLVARHDPSMIGELISMGSTSAVGGGVFVAIPKVLSKVDKVYKFAKLKVSPLKLGGMLSGAHVGWNEVEKTCLRNLYHQKKIKMNSSNNSENLPKEAFDLNPQFGMNFFKAPADPKNLSKSCQALGTIQFATISSSNLSCFQDTLMNLAPIGVGILGSEILQNIWNVDPELLKPTDQSPSF